LSAKGEPNEAGRQEELYQKSDAIQPIWCERLLRLLL
jgi:hypothetical protein